MSLKTELEKKAILRVDCSFKEGSTLRCEGHGKTQKITCSTCGTTRCGLYFWAAGQCTECGTAYVLARTFLQSPDKVRIEQLEKAVAILLMAASPKTKAEVVKYIEL
jgi:hypothetical protein